MCKRGFISLAIAVMIATTFVAQVSAQGQDRPQGQEQGQGRRSEERRVRERVYSDV